MSPTNQACLALVGRPTRVLYRSTRVLEPGPVPPPFTPATGWRRGKCPNPQAKSRVGPASSTMVAVRPDPAQGMDTESIEAKGERRLRGSTITTWSPRGAPTKCDAWSDELVEAMRTMQPSIPSSILKGPPTIERLTIELPKAMNIRAECSYSKVTIRHFGT